MNNSNNTTRLSTIDNYIRIIQSLAKRGRSNYHNFLINPLSKWSDDIPTESLEKLLNMITNSKAANSYKKPLLYKMAIIKSIQHTESNPSIPGNISINFLKSMRGDNSLSTSDEALEFMNILKEPFKEYSNLEFKRMNKQFEEEINTADPEEVEKLIKIREGEKVQIKMLQENSKAAIKEIKDSITSKSIIKTRQTAIKHLVQLANPIIPNLHEKVLDAVDELSGTFKKGLMEASAIMIYHEILKSIKNKNLDLAIQYISKYAILFRGNPKTPNFHEVDTFEKKFFSIIEKRNLWDKISK